jgi:hypothetical protein
MKGFYLSLVLGYTQFEDIYKPKKEARFMLKSQCEQIFKSLKSTPKDFHGGVINLHATNDLGRAYEVGQVFSKYYSGEALPTDEEILKDLHYMISAYRELKKLIGQDYLQPIAVESTSVPASWSIDLSHITEIAGGEVTLLPLRHKDRYSYAP